ncbi:hypothetical protein Syun_011797 [Stephania yunnanensis]|uniref:Cell wall hydroxyproline-rich glycoprotein n=1 Tax=Stephania yunnanensis TaxID=152371 RepID=A0AAP0K0N3_9MAGN
MAPPLHSPHRATLLLLILVQIGNATVVLALDDPTIMSFENPRLRQAYIALQAWKSAIFSDPLNFTSNWVGPNVCSYSGVYCAPSPYNYSHSDSNSSLRDRVVAGIDLNHADIAGYLPPELGLLKDQLALIHLNSNRFCGTVPSTFRRLNLLFEIDISNNRFVGGFPDVLLSLPSLKYLDLRFNDFEGSIPSRLFDRPSTPSSSTTTDSASASLTTSATPPSPLSSSPTTTSADASLPALATWPTHSTKSFSSTTTLLAASLRRSACSRSSLCSTSASIGCRGPFLVRCARCWEPPGSLILTTLSTTSRARRPTVAVVMVMRTVGGTVFLESQINVLQGSVPRRVRALLSAASSNAATVAVV